MENNLGAKQGVGRFLTHQLLAAERRVLGDYAVSSGLEAYSFNYTAVSASYTFHKTLVGLEHVPLVLLFHMGYKDSATASLPTLNCYRVDNDNLVFSKDSIDFTFSHVGAGVGTRIEYFYYFALPLSFAIPATGQNL